MSDFIQSGPITTLHAFENAPGERVEELLVEATKTCRLGLILPVTASDMRAAPFSHIMQQLAPARFLDTVVVVLNRTEGEADYRECQRLIEPIADRVHLLWTDGPRGVKLRDQLISAGFDASKPGKGRAVWTAFGYLLADPDLHAFVLHDCDIANFDRQMLVRLCLPMAHPSLDFEFCKAYYARCTHKMHGRVVRLLVTPLLRALITVFGADEFLQFLNAFRYPLAGEFAVSASLARSNRTPSDWGLEVGTLAEVFRNTVPKRVCQVDLGLPYEHKHQDLSADNPKKGLMAMSGDILISVFRTLASRGIIFQPGHFVSLRAAYLRTAQDAIRQYHADALINCLEYDRHSEEHAIESFAEQITIVGTKFFESPNEMDALPTWARVLAALPEFPHQLRDAVTADQKEFK